MFSATRLAYNEAKFVSVLSYVTVLGWVIAAFIYGNHKSSFARFHLRDSLGLILTAALLLLIPFIGWILSAGLVILWIQGMYHAVTGQRTHLSLIGDFYQKHLDFIK